MAKLPIKVGLEIHQQLATHKLFCNCESRLLDEVKEEFVRRLRPTQSELGEVDRAALEEAEKGLTFTYQATETSCLVEADEEPPHEANREALETVLRIALMLGAEPVHEVHFMRKIVIDGSNTTGFQRSALVALNGSLEVSGKTLGIPTICLEEDAARLVGTEGREVTYRLDRLGIPLVEIATTPDIDSAEMAKEAALRIGRLLRATRQVLRGLGTVREDLNVSVKGGARVEIKGVQDLRMISTYVQGEVDRQERLLEAGRAIKKRGVRRLERDIQELTSLFRTTKSKVIRRALDGGGVVLGARLQGFQDLLSGNLGPELAAQASVAGAGGILHSDELPAFGITRDEVKAVSSALGCGDADGFVLVADRREIAKQAMERVLDRAAQALKGVPEETRDARPDGSTVYSRPLPGSARMYPETDVPPIHVSKKWLESLGETLPEPLEERVARLAGEFNVHRQQVEQLVNDGWDDLFEELSRNFGNAGVVARTFLNTLPELKSEGVSVDSVSPEVLRSVFAALKDGRFAKEAVPRILKAMLDRGVDVKGAMEELGLRRMDRKQLEEALGALVEENLELLRHRGEDAIKPLMGMAMARLRGVAEGSLINEVLTKILQDRLAKL